MNTLFSHSYHHQQHNCSRRLFPAVPQFR
jgi:hypothetical protein